MNIVWGLVIAAVGVLFIIWGRTRSEFVIYRFFVARSRILWPRAARSMASTKSPAPS